MCRFNYLDDFICEMTVADLEHYRTAILANMDFTSLLNDFRYSPECYNLEGELQYYW